MSGDNSDDWVDSPSSPQEAGPSEAEDQNAAGAQDATEPGPTEQEEQQFPRRSVEEVERTAANMRRRTSSLSSGIAAMSPVELASAQPRQPSPPPPPRSSTIPNQIEHDPDHDRNRSPKSILPDYHDPDSPTQRRGKGIGRNPVADTWREDAYMKKERSDKKITAAEASRLQDRWECEYCGELNERGTETTTSAEPATAEPTKQKRDSEDTSTGAAGPSRAYV